MVQSAVMTTPVGRFVSGSLTETRKIDMDNRPIAEDKQQYEFGVAVRKDDPAIAGVLQSIGAHAWQEYAQFPQIQQIIGQYNFEARGFSWKIGDGDAPNRQGKKNENTAGCYVFYFKSSFAIRCCDQKNAEISAESIKRGYYVDVAFSVAGNGETGERAGIYINPQIVRFCAYGQEIVGGISANEAFGGAHAPTHLPPGASQTPLASGPMSTAGPQTMPPAASVPGIPPSNTPATTGYPGNVPTHPTFADGGGQVPQQSAAPMAPGMPQQQPAAPGFPQR